MKADWTLISFYTPLYTKVVERLKTSVLKWNVPHYIEEIPSQATWEENCAMKPQFILKTLERLKTPILWVDADAELIQCPPPAFDTPFATIIHDDLPHDHPSKVVSSVLYAAYTPHTLSLLERWKTICESWDGKEWDQIALREALRGESITPLPLSYSMIYDRLKPDDAPTILHYQASRLYKKIINGEVMPFLDL